MNATHCLCYSPDLTTAAYNLSTISLRNLTDQHALAPLAGGQRTVWNIVWGSVTTILACTWVSCHPNISFNEEKLMKMKKDLEKSREREELVKKKSTRWWKLEKQRWKKRRWPKLRIIPWIQGMLPKAEIMVVALIAPEFVVMWALRQYVAAKKITETFEGLTMTHAFFFIMGGFLLTDREGYPVRILVLGASRVLEFAYDSNVIKSVKAYLQTSNVEPTATASAKTSLNNLISLESKGETLTADVIIDAMITVVNYVVGTVETIAAEAPAIMPVALTAVLDASHLWSELLVPGELPYSSKMLIRNGQPGMERTTKVVALGYACDHAADTALRYLTNMANTTMKIALDEKLDAEEVVSGIRNEILSDAFQQKLKEKLREKFFMRMRQRICLKVREKLRSILKSLLSLREENIQDKSKQDWLGKTFVLAQTFWFVTQCIARKIQRLPLTEIELIGCAYATLSIAIYYFWWNKPFRVDFPINIPSDIPHEERELIISRPFVPSSLSEDEQRVMRAHQNQWSIFTVLKSLDGTVYNDTLFGRRVQVPTFYSGDANDEIKDDWNFRAEVAVAAVFGGIHLFAWNYQFPTHVESWLWRSCALVIVIAPVGFMAIWMISDYYWQTTDSGGSGLRFPPMVKFQLTVIILIYVVARLVILFLAVASLRRLPSGAFVTIDWLTFIAHVE